MVEVDYLETMVAVYQTTVCPTSEYHQLSVS